MTNKKIQIRFTDPLFCYPVVFERHKDEVAEWFRDVVKENKQQVKSINWTGDSKGRILVAQIMA